MYGVMQLRHSALVGKAIMLVTHTARIGNCLCWLSISWEVGLYVECSCS